MEFSYDGLLHLRDDLEHPMFVQRGTWRGCPLSYRRGDQGSAHRDTKGRARNVFTEEWDDYQFTEEEVILAVERELRRRAVPTAPAKVPEHGKVEVAV